MHIHRFSSAKEVAVQARSELYMLLDVYADTEVLLLLSGGSAFAVLDGFDGQRLSSRVTISMLDERYEYDPAVQNFAQLEMTDFFITASKAQCQWIDSRPENDESATALATRLDRDLHHWRQQYPEGKIICIQGIGSDGHTAGIMPYPENELYFDELFVRTQAWVVSYDAGEKNKYPNRITTTIRFLLDQVDASIVYAVGQEKLLVLEALDYDDTAVHTMPAYVLKKMKRVALFTDQK